MNDFVFGHAETFWGSHTQNSFSHGEVWTKFLHAFNNNSANSCDFISFPFVFYILQNTFTAFYEMLKYLNNKMKDSVNSSSLAQYYILYMCMCMCER